jgi:phosphatidylglycerol:prolipoprotein diacylglycerol transferase
MGNGIVINIDPVFLRIGGFELRWYSLFIMLGIMAAVLISTFEAKRKGLTADTVYSMAPWLILGGIIGARLFHVIDWWRYYVANPGMIIQIQQGGLAIWGGVIGGCLAVIIYTRVKHTSLGGTFDIVVPGLLLAQLIGRFGCIVNGDAAGNVTNLPWGFIYTNPAAMIPPNLFGIPTHPYPVYEQIWNLFGLVLILKFRRALKIDGSLFLGYLVFYSVGRFILTFVREENIWFWGLEEAQVIAIGILIVATGAIIYLHKKSQVNIRVTPSIPKPSPSEL